MFQKRLHPETPKLAIGNWRFGPCTQRAQAIENLIAAFGLETFERSIVAWEFRSSPSLYTRSALQIETPGLKSSIKIKIYIRNKHNFSGLSREWVGVKLVYVLPFFLGKSEHINKSPRNSQEMPGQSWESPWTVPRNVCLCVLLFIVFFWS